MGDTAEAGVDNVRFSRTGAIPAVSTSMSPQASPTASDLAFGSGTTQPKAGDPPADDATNPAVKRLMIAACSHILETCERTYMTHELHDQAIAQLSSLFIPHAEQELTSACTGSSPEAWVPFVYKNLLKVMENTDDNAGNWFIGNMSYARELIGDATYEKLVGFARTREANNDAERAAAKKGKLADQPATGDVSKLQARERFASLFETRLTKERIHNASDALHQAGFTNQQCQAASDLLGAYENLLAHPAGSNAALEKTLDAYEPKIDAAVKAGVLTVAEARPLHKWVAEYRRQYPVTTVATNEEPKLEPGEPPEREEGDPVFEAAARACDWFAQLGIAKPEMEAMHGALEVASKKDAGARAAAAVELAGGMMGIIGDVVKKVAQDPELAEQAAEHLEIVGKVFGHFAKVIKAINAIVVLSDPKASADARIDAVLEVVGCLGPVGFATKESINLFAWVFNTVGVPIKLASEDAGLRQVFAGQEPAALIEQIEALPTEAEVANHTIYHLLFTHDFFKPVKSLFSQQVTSDAWNAYWRSSESGLSPYAGELAQVTADKSGMKNVPELLRPEIADTCKRAGVSFIRKQVAEAKEWS